jgi:hypothetical protein
MKTMPVFAKTKILKLLFKLDPGNINLKNSLVLIFLNGFNNLLTFYHQTPLNQKSALMAKIKNTPAFAGCFLQIIFRA